MVGHTPTHPCDCPIGRDHTEAEHRAEMDKPKPLTISVTLSEANWRLLLGAASVGVQALTENPDHHGATGASALSDAWGQFGSAVARA